MLLDILKLIGAILLLIIVWGIYIGLLFLASSLFVEGIKTAPTWATAYALSFLLIKLLTLGK